MSDQTADKRRFALALISIVALLGCIVFLALAPITAEVRSVLLGIVTMSFAAPVKDVYGFYYGSSQGSKDKDAVIAGSDNGPGTVTVTTGGQPAQTTVVSEPGK